MKYSYASLLTNNLYIHVLATMLYTFNQTNSKYSMVTLVTPEISTENRAIIEALGAEVIEVPVLMPNNNGQLKSNYEAGNSPTWHPALTKMHVFNLTQFDKVVYIDADMVLLHNIDELFDKPSLSGVADPGWFGRSNQFNAGLMVLEPNHEQFIKLVEIMNSYANKQNWIDAAGNLVNNLDDQQCFYQIFTDWPNRPELHLPNIYNVQLCFLTIKPLFPEVLKTIKILHMSCCARPWFCKTIEEFQEECSRWLPFNAFAIYNWYGQLINDCIKLLNDNGYFSPDLKPLTCISY